MDIFTQKLDTNLSKLFIRNFKNLAEIFGEERVLKFAKTFKIADFATRDYLERNDIGSNAYYKKQGYPVINANTWYDFKEYKADGWERTVRKSAVEYIVPDSLQLKESALIKLCLVDMHQGLEKFEIKAYHCDNNAEVYIPCENNKLLYCPLVAFRDNDYSIIEKRHRDYMQSYYGNTQEREIRYLPRELATLDTPTATVIKNMLDAKSQNV